MMDASMPQKPLEKRLRDLLDRRRTISTLRKLTLPQTNHVDFSSNDFLSLSTCPQLKALFLKELQETNLPQGSGGSRLLDGNSSYAEDLERGIARFHGADAGLLFNSGFDANAGFFACVPQPDDVIVYDELVHASVHDGMRLSRAGKMIAFKHNSVEDLRNVLQDVVEEDVLLRREQRSVIVAVESIYSMDGDLAPLKEIMNAVEELVGPERGHVVVDEAHSTGVLGPQGRGLVCELGLEGRVFARLHTFGKALASSGGGSWKLQSGGIDGADYNSAIILGSPTLRDYLINYARPLIYTTFMSYPALASIRASYKLLEAGQTVPLQQNLHSLTQMLFVSLNELRQKSSAARKTLKVPSACPGSPIFAVQAHKPRELAACLQRHGMMVRAVVSPTVPLGTERVRVCLHAGNTMSEIQTLVGVLGEWCEGTSLEVGEGSKSQRVTAARL
jgi:8-amino-7-oxononanoate synthase